MKRNNDYAPRFPRTAGNLGELLLDSSLIVTTNNKSLYNVKVIVCNNYIQVYELENTKSKKNKNLEIEEEEKTNIIEIDTDDLRKANIPGIDNNDLKKTNATSTPTIEAKNINRSKLQCQRLAKCNADEWKTFITLTFAENITDIAFANKKFRYFIDKVQRKFKQLKYICIPEFQKRGAVHYHLLTNIPLENTDLIYTQIDNEKFKHIKYWNEGFTKVDSLNNDIKKIVGYVSKYMTKDIDDRLYNRHRYFYSRNLIKPQINYLDLDDIKHREFFENLLNKKALIYTNQYQNSYNDDHIVFKEYL